MMEPKSMAICRQRGRYTLTYNEETAARSGRNCCRQIHPHIQWGNSDVSPKLISLDDTPSHTVRELISLLFLSFLFRYTLTYSEGTIRGNRILFNLPIHPHIQWGNRVLNRQKRKNPDTPSHTVRERRRWERWHDLRGYTLTYSEGTLSIYAAFSRSKYLVVKFTQKPFVILVTYLICRKISFVNKKS